MTKMLKVYSKLGSQSYRLFKNVWKAERKLHKVEAKQRNIVASFMQSWPHEMQVALAKTTDLNLETILAGETHDELESWKLRMESKFDEDSFAYDNVNYVGAIDGNAIYSEYSYNHDWIGDPRNIARITIIPGA